MIAFVAAGFGRQQDQHRAYALSAGTDDVFGNLAHQWHFGVQFLAYDRVDCLHLAGNGFYDRGLVWGGCSGQDWSLRMSTMAPIIRCRVDLALPDLEMRLLIRKFNC